MIDEQTFEKLKAELEAEMHSETIDPVVIVNRCAHCKRLGEITIIFRQLDYDPDEPADTEVEACLQCIDERFETSDPEGGEGEEE